MRDSHRDPEECLEIKVARRRISASCLEEVTNAILVAVGAFQAIATAINSFWGGCANQLGVSLIQGGQGVVTEFMLPQKRQIGRIAHAFCCDNGERRLGDDGGRVRAVGEIVDLQRDLTHCKLLHWTRRGRR